MLAAEADALVADADALAAEADAFDALAALAELDALDPHALNAPASANDRANTATLLMVFMMPFLPESFRFL